MAQDDPAVPVIKVPGQGIRSMRDYQHLLPGVREFDAHHALAPQAELHFGLVTLSFPMKPLPLERASLEAAGAWFSTAWSEDLTVLDDGWFVLPDSAEAEKRGAKLYVSHRKNARSASWVVDVHTPGLPPAIYRLGDLRLECRVYLAIEWHSSRGRKLMGEPTPAPINPPMNELCGGQDAIFFNTRPWPRLQAYTISDGGRTARHELNGHRISVASLMLELNGKLAAPAWSDDARIEFLFYDGSHWTERKNAPAAGQENP